MESVALSYLLERREVCSGNLRTLALSVGLELQGVACSWTAYAPLSSGDKTFPLLCVFGCRVNLTCLIYLSSVLLTWPCQLNTCLFLSSHLHNVFLMYVLVLLPAEKHPFFSTINVWQYILHNIDPFHGENTPNKFRLRILCYGDIMSKLLFVIICNNHLILNSLNWVYYKLFKKTIKGFSLKYRCR